MRNPYNPGPPFRPSSPYGDRPDPVVKGKFEFHSGQDFAAPPGTPIPAATPGEVVYSGFNTNLGNTVIVKNPYGYSLYGHMISGTSLPQVGQQVWPGDPVGYVGSTGARTTGPHLHYSVIKSDRNIRSSSNGGPIGVSLNKGNTIDPSQYDASVPYAPQTSQAWPATSGSSDDILDREHSVARVAPFVQFGLYPPEGNGSFADRFGDWSSASPDGSISTPAGEAPPPQGLPGRILDYIRRQNAQETSKPSSTVFDTGAQAVPFVSDNDEQTDSDNSFNGRFGNWRPGLPNSDEPGPSARPLGIFTGQPMPQWITPPPIFGFK